MWRRALAAARSRASREVGIGNKIGIRMLHSCQTLGRPHHLPQTLIIELVGKRPRRAPAKNGPHRNDMILLGHVLVDHVVRKASQRKPPARKRHFDLIGG